MRIRQVDAFQGYRVTSESETGSDTLLLPAFPEPLAGQGGSEAPASRQEPLPYPSSYSDAFTTWPELVGGLDEAAAHARDVDAQIRAREIDGPRFQVLHDRLRTPQAWEKGVDALFEGALTTPAAGASTLTSVFPLNPPFPGSPGQALYLYLNFVSVAAAGTTLTGIWSLSFVSRTGAVIPLGVFSGLGAFNNRAGLLTPIPLDGGSDDKTLIGSLRLFITAGSTVTSVSFYAQLSLSYVYRYAPNKQQVMRDERRG